MKSGIRRGDIVLVNFEPVMGSEQGGIRPAVIIQNDVFNTYSPITIIAAMTSKITSKKYLTSVFVSKQDSKLEKDSTILLNQIRAIDKSRIMKKMSSLDSFTMSKVNKALKISLGLD